MAPRKAISISFPSAMKKWVDQQVKERGFGTASEFVRHVLRAEWEHSTATEFEKFLLDGVESPKRAFSRELVDELKRDVQRRATAVRTRKRKSA